MSKKFFLALFLFALLFSLSACGKGRVIAVVAGEEPQTVTLQAGDTLRVTLPGNPTTGYAWELSQVNDTLLKPQGELAFTPEGGDLVGAGGTFAIEFKAQEVGSTTLLFIYRRPFEADTPPLQTFELTVSIE